MDIKKDFVVRTIAGQDVVVPIGENVAKFNGIISLNETAAFLSAASCLWLQQIMLAQQG